MKKISSKLFVALSGIMALGVSVPAVAQSATGTGTIKIVQPLTLTNDRGLAFGTIIKPASGSGTVTLSAADVTSRSKTGDIAFVKEGQTSAKFTLNGEGGQKVSVRIPETFTMSGGGETLTVSTLTDLEDVTDVTLSSVLGQNGTKAFYVGGTVTIANDTKSANYTGSFTVTASYN